MTSYKPADLESQTKEIADAISTLSRYGFKISANDQLKQRLEPFSLFNGDDGLFKSLLPEVQNYFEYGCGKSTEFVYKFTNSNIFSVDTSQEWARRLQGIATDDRLKVKWVDVGDVGDWGRPTSFAKRGNFSEYTNWLWASNVAPDLVLIDGRFRVCSFLTTLKHAPPGTRIIFDDYHDRPFYHVAGEFLDVIESCGRQALFEVDQASKSRVTDSVITEFRNVIE